MKRSLTYHGHNFIYLLFLVCSALYMLHKDFAINLVQMSILLKGFAASILQVSGQGHNLLPLLSCVDLISL